METPEQARARRQAYAAQQAGACLGAAAAATASAAKTTGAKGGGGRKQELEEGDVVALEMARLQAACRRSEVEGDAVAVRQARRRATRQGVTTSANETGWMRGGPIDASEQAEVQQTRQLGGGGGQQTRRNLALHLKRAELAALVQTREALESEVEKQDQEVGRVGR
jgi:hypothetical protein